MIDGVLDSEDEYVLDKYAYNEGKAASVIGAPRSANPYTSTEKYNKNSRAEVMWVMGYLYDNNVGNA